MSQETKSFWDAVKNHLSSDGLREVIHLYPELREEANDLLSVRLDQEGVLASFVRSC